MKKFITAEINEILKHKWIESEKAGRDLGRQAIEDWIDKHSENFVHEYLHQSKLTTFKSLTTN